MVFLGFELASLRVLFIGSTFYIHLDIIFKFSIGLAEVRPQMHAKNQANRLKAIPVAMVSAPRSAVLS